MFESVIASFVHVHQSINMILLRSLADRPAPAPEPVAPGSAVSKSFLEDFLRKAKELSDDLT